MRFAALLLPLLLAPAAAQAPSPPCLAAGDCEPCFTGPKNAFGANSAKKCYCTRTDGEQPAACGSKKYKVEDTWYPATDTDECEDACDNDTPRGGCYSGSSSPSQDGKNAMGLQLHRCFCTTKEQCEAMVPYGMYGYLPHNPEGGMGCEDCSLLPYGWATPFEWALPEKANCDDAIERVSSREECTRAANSLNLKFKGDKAKMLKKSKAKKYAQGCSYRKHKKMKKSHLVFAEKGKKGKKGKKKFKAICRDPPPPPPPSGGKGDGRRLHA
jgi:hypothetical protein